MVRTLLAIREDVFPDYTIEGFGRRSASTGRSRLVGQSRGPRACSTAWFEPSKRDEPAPRAAWSFGRLGWYPLLLAIAWYLEVYAVGRVEPAAGARSFALVVVAAVAITVACIAVLGRDRGSMAAAIVLVGCIVVRQPILVVPFAAGFVLLLIERRWSDQGRMHLPWQRVHEGMTALVAVLLAIQIGQVVTFTEPAPMMARTAWAAQPVDAATTPNMYLILADAHGRADVLESLYHHDDQPFLDGLRDIGFDVASASHSNYALTRFSLGSMLTSTYLDPLNSSRSTDWQDDLPGGRSTRTPRSPPASGRIPGDGHL